MSLQDRIRDLTAEHGDDAVAAALRFLPRIIALLKRGHERRIIVALDRAHSSIDMALEERIRRDQGEGHE